MCCAMRELALNNRFVESMEDSHLLVVSECRDDASYIIIIFRAFQFIWRISMIDK